jgi:hypothetical protein
MDLAAVMDEVAARLDTIDGLRVYAYPADNVHPPAAVVTYPDIAFDSAYQRGSDRMTLPVVLLIGKVSARASRDLVAVYAHGSGVKSIKRVLEAGTEQVEPSSLLLTGGANSYVLGEDHASLDIVGDIDLRADAALDDWTGAAIQTAVAKFVATGNQRSYRLGLSTGGAPLITWSSNGTNVLSATATATLSALANGARQAWRATLDVDNGAAGRTARFYRADTGAGPWAQLGADVVQAGVTSIFAGSAELSVGAHSLGANVERLAGRVFGAEVRSGIDGTVVANPDFTVHDDGTDQFVDASGRTWSVITDAHIFGPFDPYTSFDSLRVVDVEFDVVSVARVEYLAATLQLDISGPGA